MIGFIDTLTLARTKLRTKRIVLYTSIAVASILFAALIALVTVFTGVEKSATYFIKKAGNDHYLVSVSPYIPSDKIFPSQELPMDEIKEIKAFEKQYYKDIKDKYASLGLKYDPSSEVPALQPAAWKSPSLPEDQRVSVNYSSPVIAALENYKFEEYSKTATNKFNDLKKVGSRYGVSGYYLQQSSLLPGIPNSLLVQNGKEDFSDTEQELDNFLYTSQRVHAIHNSDYAFTDQKLLGRYLLATNASSLKGIPVVVTAQEAVSYFGKDVGIGEEPKMPSEKRAWMKTVQERLNGKIYQVCYRNSAEQTILTKIQQDYADMKNNEKTEDYQKPSLLYDYPTTACGDIPIKSDARTTAEKQLDEKDKEIQEKLGTYVAPAHKLLTFQIVGFTDYQQTSDTPADAGDYVKNLLSTSSEGMGSVSADIPLQMYDSLPETLKFNDIREEMRQRGKSTVTDDDFATRILEFRSANDARQFLENEACPSISTNCAKQFSADPYGSNYLILDDIGNLFRKVANIAFPSALGLAAIIIWFTISRIMAENRKETAVYRAMGAKRRDVTSIYVTYVLLVALRIAIVSLALGVTAALAINYFYGSTLTDTAVTAFGIIDGAPSFSLFSLNSPLLVAVVLSIFVISLIASVQPLIRNVRRNPIRDMRDE